MKLSERLLASAQRLLAYVQEVISQGGDPKPLIGVSREIIEIAFAVANMELEAILEHTQQKPSP